LRIIEPSELVAAVCEPLIVALPSLSSEYDTLPDERGSEPEVYNSLKFAVPALNDTLLKEL
jgi:hypothetical protein